MKHIAATHLIALAGVGVFFVLNLPLPWLLGPILACLVAALAGVPLRGIASLNNLMRSILGVAVGATFTVTLVVTMAGMWTTLILVPLMVLLIGLVGVPYFQRLWGFDLPPATMARCRADCRTCCYLAKRPAATCAPCP